MPVKCEYCKGRKKDPLNPRKSCPKCWGTGFGLDVDKVKRPKK